MACTIQNQTYLTLPSNDQQNFDHLIKYVESLPVSPHKPKDYFALAVVIQQEIEPIIRIKDPEIKMEGKTLSTEFTALKGFQYQMKSSSKHLDQTLTFLNTNQIPLTESIQVARTEEKVKKISKVIILICRTNKQQSILEAICETATYELIRMKDSMEGPFNFSAQALFSDKPPSPASLISSSEPNCLEITQDAISREIENNFKQLEFTLKPNEVFILERHFDHGESDTSNTRISFALKDHEVTTTQVRQTLHSTFTDLRFQSEDLGHFE